MVGEEGPERRPGPAHQEEVAERGEVGQRQDQGHVPHADPGDQRREHKQTYEDVEHPAGGVQLAKQGGQLVAASTGLQHCRILKVRQIGHQQGDTQRQHQGQGVARGTECLDHQSQLFSDARTCFAEVGVAVGDPAPPAAEQVGDGNGYQRHAGPDQQQPRKRNLGREQAHD